jgi:hypothetical protein
MSALKMKETFVMCLQVHNTESGYNADDRYLHHHHSENLKTSEL